MSLREPVLHATPILSLRPTQITLGMTEVYQKRDAWRTKSAQDLAKFLEAHMVPVIAGLGGAHYLIDHHHLARALYEEGVKSVFVTVVADLSRLTADHFWNMMDFHGWTHPYDAKGRRLPLLGAPENGQDDGGRSLSFARRRIAQRRRVRQGTPRRSRNSSGPISSARASRPRRSGRTSTLRWRWRSPRRRPATPITCLDGAARTAMFCRDRQRRPAGAKRVPTGKTALDG